MRCPAHTLQQQIDQHGRQQVQEKCVNLIDPCQLVHVEWQIPNCGRKWIIESIFYVQFSKLAPSQWLFNGRNIVINWYIFCGAAGHECKEKMKKESERLRYCEGMAARWEKRLNILFFISIHIIDGDRIWHFMNEYQILIFDRPRCVCSTLLCNGCLLKDRARCDEEWPNRFLLLLANHVKIDE